jgi:hypothetical protein
MPASLVGSLLTANCSTFPTLMMCYNSPALVLLSLLSVILPPCVLLAQDARFNKAVDVSTGYRTKSVLCMPFIGTDGTVVGVIQLINKETGPFDEDDIDIMTMFASMAAPIVQVQFLFGCRACLDVCICHMFVMCGSPRRTHNCSRVWQRNLLRNRAQSSAENPCCPSDPR